MYGLTFTFSFKDFFFFFFSLLWTIFKVFIEVVTIFLPFLFNFLSWRCVGGMWDLSVLAGSDSPSALEREVLTRRPLEKSLHT